MLSRKILFLAIVSSSIYNYASGQAQDARIPKVVPPSPNAAALQKYGDIPVSAYTGMPSISIPLYDIKSGDISFPISISYNASGVKVADEASRVGLSWVLNAGGVISRSVVGGDDFEFLTYSYNNQTIPEIPKVPRFDQGADFNMKDGCDVILNGYGIDYSLPSTIFTEGNYDLQPDQYSYNFNGHSGKFGLRRNRNAVLNTIEKIDIKVIGSDASSWEIKTPDGTLYKFEQFETYVESGGTSNHHKSSWYLTKIISATGRTVDFVYSSNSSYIHSIGSYFESKPGANIGSSTNGDSGPHNISMYAAAVPGKWYTNLYLTKILFDNGEVQFNYLADRLDISGDVRLTDIQIFSKKHGVAVNQLIKSWNFNYSYFEGTNFTGCFSNPNATTENLTKRLKLVSVQESNGSSSLPPYQFSYNNENDNPVLLPPKSWFGRDHWGYYNGKINTSLIPTHSNGCSNDPIAFYLGSMGNDRNANPQYNQLFVLNKIKYPTGGFTTFEYETNDFDNSNSVINDHSYFANYVGTIPATAEAGFSNIQAGGTFTAALDLTEIVSCGQMVPLEASFIKLSGLDPATINQITYSLKNPSGVEISGGSVGSWLGSTSPPMTEYLGTLQSNSGVRMTLMKSLVPGIYTWTFFVPAGITGAGVNIKYSKYETSDPIVNSGHTVHNALFGGGLRVKKIADYPHVSAIPKVRKYNYHYELNGNWYSYGRSMSKPNYSYFIEHTGIAGYNPITDHEIIAFSNVLMRESDSNIPLNGSAGGNTVGYDKVEEVIGENGENGKTVYEYQNQPDVIFNYTHTKHVLGQLTNIPRKAPFGGTVSNPGNGNLLKQIDYVFKDGGYTPVKEVTNTYQDLILAASSAAVIGIEKRAGSGHNPFVDPPACYVTSYVYPAITENRYVLTATTSKINDVTGATNPIITITEYTYDNSTHLQLTAISEYKSNGDKITTTFKYPEDFPDVQSDAANLLMKGTAYMHAVPVTQQLSITKGANQFLTEAQINRYQVLNGKVFPKEKAILEIVQPININTPPPSYNPASGTFPSNYKARLFFDSYDGNGNITQVHKSDEASLTYIWDYFSSYPVAEATNATTSTCAFTSFEADGPGNWIFSGTSVNDLSSFTGKKTYTLNGSNDITKSGLDAGKTYIVSYWSKTGSATINGAVAVAGMNRLGWTYYEHILSASTTSIIVTGNVTIDELRLFPKGSLMTSYTYEPLIGMTSQCDANNRVTYYGYDVFGRLKDIKDQDGSIIKTIDYNYKQP